MSGKGGQVRGRSGRGSKGRGRGSGQYTATLIKNKGLCSTLGFFFRVWSERVRIPDADNLGEDRPPYWDHLRPQHHQ